MSSSSWLVLKILLSSLHGADLYPQVGPVVMVHLYAGDLFFTTIAYLPRSHAKNKEFRRNNEGLVNGSIG